MRSSIQKCSQNQLQHLKNDIFAQPSDEQIIIDLKSAFFLPIDVQKEFCDPTHEESYAIIETENVVKDIANLSPEFNKYGLETCWVYYAQGDNERYPEYDAGFHIVEPQLHDFIVGKYEDSAFDDSKKELENLLIEKNKKSLFVAGFNSSACVLRTVLGALHRGYKVYMLSDLVENDHPYGEEYAYFIRRVKNDYEGKMSFSKFEKGNIAIIESKRLLKVLKNQ